MGYSLPTPTPCGSEVTYRGDLPQHGHRNKKVLSEHPQGGPFGHFGTQSSYGTTPAARCIEASDHHVCPLTRDHISEAPTDRRWRRSAIRTVPKRLYTNLAPHDMLIGILQVRPLDYADRLEITE